MKRISSAAIPVHPLTGLIIPLALLLTTGCMNLRRSAGSGYMHQAFESTAAQDRRNEEMTLAASALGFADTRELSDDQEEAILIRIELRKAESRLSGEAERDQYFINKPYMSSDRERLSFLGKGSIEERQLWLEARGINGAHTAHPPAIQGLINENDITTNMTKQAVRESWGEPELIEVAGNPIYGNERWHYSEQVSSTEGYQTERRTVIFESGRVVGWQKQ